MEVFTVIHLEGKSYFLKTFIRGNNSGGGIGLPLALKSDDEGVAGLLLRAVLSLKQALS
jgi:hypothetical protein